MGKRVEPSDEPNEESRLEEERLLELEPYDIVENPVLRHEYRMLERGTDENGEFLWTEGRFQTDSIHFDEHVHVAEDETWKVLSGEFTVTVDGVEQTLGAGEEITIPKGTPHIQRSPPGTEVHVLHELRPPLALDALLRSMAMLAQDGQTDAEGIPNLLQAAVVFDTYPGTYETGIPITVQKRVFKLLAIIGRLRGYRADYSTDR